MKNPAKHKDFWPALLLCFISLGIYFFYFSFAFLRPNELLAGITGDALKNYYTFVFHSTVDKNALHFEGMNFPFGEHVIYTDCQPLLTFIFRLLPFTAPYLVGILHYLLFLSFVLAPVFIYKLLRKLEFENTSAVSLSLAIILLSPQFQKISGGHHGLAYGCIIPGVMLLLFNTCASYRSWPLVSLSVFNFLMFFIHPYMGFSVAVFSFIVLLIFALYKAAPALKSLLFAAKSGIIPVMLFKFFMLLTDRHPGRTTEPFGKNTLLENVDSLLAPDFGPFQTMMEKLFPNKIDHLESHSYLGFFIVVLLLVSIVSFFIYRRKLKVQPVLFSMFLASLFLLFISFGWHNLILSKLGVSIASLNQFRAVCRFGWTFYYVLPIFLFDLMNRNITTSLIKVPRRTVPLLTILYLVLNLIEANSYFLKDHQNFWKYRNILSPNHLLPGEKTIIEGIKSSGAQAILAMPVFHIGSETFARTGGDNSMIPAMFYSLHSGLPILGVAMSRTSVSETIQSLDLLNIYKRNKVITKHLDEAPLVIITNRDPLMPDEQRMLLNYAAVFSNDSVQVGYLPFDKLLSGVDIVHKNLHAELEKNNNIRYLKSGEDKPFISTMAEGLNTIMVLDSNSINSGKYIVSFHYHKENNPIENNPDLLLTRADSSGYRWEEIIPCRIISGFYKNFQVFEYPLNLDSASRYEFILMGGGEGKYHISNFLLRPAHINIEWLEAGDTLRNNFPINAL